MLTCYDAAFARLLDRAEVDVLLVGDSLNQVIAGQETTLSATLDQMIYHAAAVRRGAPRHAAVRGPAVPHLPGIGRRRRSAMRAACSQETGANGVKLEGGRHMAETVRALVERGIPVMGHLGLTPQSVHALGGYRVQGREGGARRPSAGATHGRWRRRAPAPSCSSWCRPRWRSGCRRRSRFPPSGSAPAPHCDGQVLVLHDMLGLNEGFSPKFLKRYAELGAAVRAAVRAYRRRRSGRHAIPAKEHSFE